MPTYFYTAKSLEGDTKTGTVEVKDEHQLARILHEQGFVLIAAELKGEKNAKGGFKISLPFLNKVSLTEKLMFTRNLQVMISAGLPLPKALNTLASQTRSEKFKKALIGIMEDVNNGSSCSDSLAKFPDIFSELFISMIKVGEESGTLDSVLKTLASQLEKENELKSKIKGAMMYPAVIVTAMMGIGILMLIIVVPKLAETFKEFGMQLPLTTRITISFGEFLAQKWYVVILLVPVVFTLIKMITKTKIGKKIVDKLVLKIPIISALIKKTNSAFTVRTLGSLIAAGVPLVKGLEVTANTLGNYYFKEAISKSIEEIKKGEKLSVALKNYQNLYLPIIIQMIAVGEETGETSSILMKLADFFEEEVSNATKNLASIMEPILMMVVGAAVGFFAISMIQPMYSMLGAIQ